MNPYHAFVQEFAALRQRGQALPLGGLTPAARPVLAPDAPRVLIFSPHPDDECIIGGLALRLLRQAKLSVINVAVTQGSKRERQAERYRELQAACHYLGFGLQPTALNGLERINVVTRKTDLIHWRACVEIVADVLSQHRPKVIFVPHVDDWNSTHIGTHWLVVDALKTLGRDFACTYVETEFWGQMTAPNLMVESSTADVADLVSATSFHVGEVQRNPYHVLLPAWMMDNVRRGTELVGGQGQGGPPFTFATLYRLRRWAEGNFVDAGGPGRTLAAAEDPATLLA